ncbi:MAG: cell surface protein SprA [Candidatus Zixiibacteriota bacterium]|nr:MAG: cell surface protein SprA [candidate division Zixibacteria bacterium]
MNSFRSRIRVLVISLLTLALAPSAIGQIGFQAGLAAPSGQVTSYKDAFEQFSVARYPRSKIILSDRMAYTVLSNYSNFEEGSIRLTYEFYNRKGHIAGLVPVSVDARSYYDYRINEWVRRALLEGAYRILNDPGRRGRGGLAFRVGLPKRFDRIFGEGGAGLKVAGFRRITFAGRSQWTDAAESETYRQNKFPSLRMEQISRFEITGTIGSKISVKVSQDSQTDIPLANRIQIRYKGDDDDILRAIEAGNTTLSLPNTQFVGYSSRIQGLFGIKTEAQIGQLNLTAIASQEKGSTERSSFTATGEENAEYVRDYEYLERRVFDLGLPGELERDDEIIELYVYETDDPYRPSPDAVEANVWVDPDNPGTYPGEDVESSGNHEVVQIPVEQYDFFDDKDRNLHYVVFSRSRDRDKNLGYYMKVLRGSDTVEFGNISNPSLLELKLLALPTQKATPDLKTWDLMWRNCYSIPQGISIDDINIKVYRGLDGTEMNPANKDYQETDEGTTFYMEILGLDQRNTADMVIPDGLLDGYQDVFRPEWGLLMFPNRRPFDTDTTYTDANGISTPQLAVTVPNIYEYESPARKTEKSEYYLKIITKTRSTKIKLNRANIIEGSETIKINGRTLARGTDYQINYDIGQITLLTEEAADPNSEISIDYEYAPFFAVQKKTLFGARAEYEWSKDFRFGSTVLYKSDKTQERKPKVGQETARMTVLDADMSLKLHPNFLTKVVDALPFVETETSSNIGVVAEVAQSHPNPNINDVAYVDDFESAQDRLSLGTSRTRWTEAAPPFPAASQAFQRGKMLWHTPRELRRVEEVYDREVAAGEGSIRTLRLIYRPSAFLGDGDGVSESWAGIMRYFGASVDAKRAQLFEVRLKVYDSIGAKLHFDFGRINEDVNSDGFAFTEDINDNKAVDESEDVGLDGLPDEQEPGYDPVTNPDPSGDNWFFQGEGDCPVPGGCGQIDWESDEWFYEYLNGTEGNRRDPGVTGLPDQEALSRGLGFETVDAYFSFVLDLTNNPDSFRVENSEKNGWVTYRIPIRDSLAVDDFVTSSAVLRPSWDKITHVRIWFESDPAQSDPDTVEIADWYFVQSNWQDSVIFGPDSASSYTRFVVAEVSDDENVNFVPPPGVEAYRDPTTNITEAQRALLLDFEDLHHGDSCLATKDLLTVDRYSGYRRMEMYVHGDYADPTDEGNIKFFFRIGQDAANYYEYYTDIYQGWDERNYINIDFNEITALKDSAQKAQKTGFEVDVDDGVRYRVFGNPDVNKVRYFASGLINNHPDSTRDITGQVWVDELRVTEVRKDVGTAGRVTLTGNLADLFNYSLSFESRDPYFRGLSAATRGGSTDNLGSGETRTVYGFRVTMNMSKFLPRSWGAALPVTFSYDKAIRTPLLRANSDIVLPDDIRQQEQSVNESRGFSVNSSFNRKGRNPVFNILLNRVRSSFSYRRFTQRSVTTPYSFGESYNVRSNFDFSVSKVPTLPIFFWTKPIPVLKKTSGSTLGLYPEKWTASANFNRSLSVSDDINFNRRSSNQRNFDGRMDMTYRVFENLKAILSYSTNRDLSDPDLVRISLKDPKLGLEKNFAQNVSVTYNPHLISIFRMGFSYKANYSDMWLRQYRARSSVLTRSAGVSGQFDHTKLLRKRTTRRGSRRRGADQQRPVYAPVLDALNTLGSWIEPLNYSYTESYSNSLPGMALRPSLAYRFGLRDEAEVASVEDVVGTRTTKESVRYELISGFNLFGGIGTRVKFAESVGKDLYRQGARSEDKSTIWPDLTIRIQQFKTFPVFKNVLNKFIDIFAPRTGYSRQSRESRNLDTGILTSSSVDKDFRPLLQVSFRLIRSLSLTVAYTVAKGERKSYNLDTGEIQSETHKTKKTLAFTSKYSFTSPKGISVPFFGRMKFKSTVDIEASVRMNSDVSETSQAGGPFVIQTDKSDFMFTPVISYTFSQAVKGGLTLRWQDVNDNHRGRKNHTREVQIWTEISF